MNYHELHNGKLIEVRATPRNDVQEAEIYYAVHKVSIGTAVWFHHAGFIADSMDMIYTGLLVISRSIAEELDNADATITPVMIYSLLATDAEVLASSDEFSLGDKISEIIAEDKDDVFAVFGLIGGMTMTLMRVQAQDAFAAAANAVNAVKTQHNDTFSPLVVAGGRQAVANELIQHFNRAATDIRALLGAPSLIH